MFEIDLKKDINKMYELALGYEPFDLYSTYNTVFINTNENIKPLLKPNLCFKKVLSVTSGGDFPLECILKGIREIDCFDINRLTFYFLELKMAAIKALTYEEFFAFYFSDNILSLMNSSIYLKIREFLSKDYLKIWDAYYELTGGSLGYHQKLLTIFYTEYKRYSSISTKRQFYNLKKILLTEKITMRYYDISLDCLFEEKDITQYDLVYYSNVLEFSKKMKGKEISILEETFENHLNKKGTIIGNYYIRKPSLSDFCWDYMLLHSSMLAQIQDQYALIQVKK